MHKKEAVDEKPKEEVKGNIGEGRIERQAGRETENAEAGELILEETYLAEIDVEDVTLVLSANR